MQQVTLRAPGSRTMPGKEQRLPQPKLFTSALVDGRAGSSGPIKAGQGRLRWAGGKECPAVLRRGEVLAPVLHTNCD